ncbi:dihydrofolate reductase [Actinomyces sp. ZJ308]|uniref:dihydrofolate reductase n=1 Tax=Actinomyces sp. ZJ308 TaxID=2708342 RepID=UPI00142091D4|nr:dihydrofolate reductase [Actinomyces sp. ZJ308]
MSGLGMIWAQDVTGLLGADGDMLWRVPADFAHFKATTMGCGLVMGRTTWESLGGALPGRRNVVLTRDRFWQAEGAIRAGSLREGLSVAARGLAADLGPDSRQGTAAGLPRLWVIGGGSVYEQALAQGLPDVLVVSVLDLDATSRARERGLPDSALVHAPGISSQEWVIDPARSDSRGRWRPASGDARWRVETWRHL